MHAGRKFSTFTEVVETMEHITNSIPDSPVSKRFPQSSRNSIMSFSIRNKMPKIHSEVFFCRDQGSWYAWRVGQIQVFSGPAQGMRAV